MMRVIASRFCMMALYIYRLFVKRRQKTLQDVHRLEAKPKKVTRRTFVKDSYRDEYYVR